MSRFLLVYPPVPETYWSYKHVMPFVGKKALMPPLGLATVAAMIPEGHDIRIKDENVASVTDADLAWADYLLISGMIVQADGMRRLIDRAAAAGVASIVGGPYATSAPEAVAAADYLVLGEAETIFAEFLSDLLAGRARRVYDTNTKPDIRETPVPRYDLLSLADYDTVPMQFSRGCPFHCEFCDIVNLFGHRPRTKTPQQMVAELEAIRAAGFSGSVFVVDDNFIGNKRAVKEALAAMTAWQETNGRPFRFLTEASINLADDPELMDMMVAAGFTMVFVGIESPVADSLAGAGKAQNLKRSIAKSIRTIQEAGIDVTGGFIIGFDSDPPDVFDRQIEFVRQLAVPTAMVGLLMALPNTRLAERLAAEGRLLGSANGNNTHDVSLNFIPRLPREVLEEGYRRVLKTIYRPRNYFDRCLRLLSRLPKAQRNTASRRRPGRREVRAFVLSLLRQSFSSYGLAYLGYLIRALAKRPDQIIRIVTWAVQGHHYFTITKTMFRRRARHLAREGREAWRQAADRLVVASGRSVPQLQTDKG